MIESLLLKYDTIIHSSNLDMTWIKKWINQQGRKYVMLSLTLLPV